jgi:hypothetical protein
MHALVIMGVRIIRVINGLWVLIVLLLRIIGVIQTVVVYIKNHGF